MAYTKKEFDKCLFNPMVDDLFEEYPDLKAINQNEKLVRYICAVYDPKSPLVTNHRDLVQRKQNGAVVAGYDIVKDLKDLEQVFNMKDPVARQAIVRFLTEFIFPREWFLICANEQTFYEYGERMMRPIDDQTDDKNEMQAVSIKTKLSQDMADILVRIENGYKRLFGDEVDPDALRKGKRTSAESMAATV